VIGNSGWVRVFPGLSRTRLRETLSRPRAIQGFFSGEFQDREASGGTEARNGSESPSRMDVPLVPDSTRVR